MSDNVIARTGRVQNADNPENRLPVSCTVFVVEDSMEGENGIEASGDLSRMLSAMERELRYICLNCDLVELRMARVYVQAALSLLEKSTAA